MRVVAGSAKGRRLQVVPGTGTRPILDRVKTALFDTLRPQIAECEFLDLFAGSGGVGIEALSQGASHCVFIDIEKKAVDTIRKNLETTALTSLAEVRHTDAFSFLRARSRAFDIIYVAPPQYQSLWIQTMHAIAERPALLNGGGQVIVQIDPDEYEELELAKFKEVRSKRYGNTLLVFYGAT